MAGTTSWFLAAASGNVARLRQMLDAGVDIDSKDKSLRTALHHAARVGHAAAVSFLLTACADCSLRDEFNNTALALQLLGDFFDEAVAGMLLRSSLRHSRPLAGLSASVVGKLSGISLILDSTTLKAIDFLLKERCFDVHDTDARGRTPLALACRHGAAHLALIKRLVAAGARLGAVDRDGMSVLRHAMLSGSSLLVRALLFAGAPVTPSDWDPLPAARDYPSFHWLPSLSVAPDTVLMSPKLRQAAELAFPLPAPSETPVLALALQQALTGNAVTTDAYMLMRSSRDMSGASVGATSAGMEAGGRAGGASPSAAGGGGGGGGGSGRNAYGFDSTDAARYRHGGGATCTFRPRKGRRVNGSEDGDDELADGACEMMLMASEGAASGAGSMPSSPPAPPSVPLTQSADGAVFSAAVSPADAINEATGFDFSAGALNTPPTVPLAATTPPPAPDTPTATPDSLSQTPPSVGPLSGIPLDVFKALQLQRLVYAEARWRPRAAAVRYYAAMDHATRTSGSKPS